MGGGVSGNFVFRLSDIASGAFLGTEGVSVRVGVIKYKRCIVRGMKVLQR